MEKGRTPQQIFEEAAPRIMEVLAGEAEGGDKEAARLLLDYYEALRPRVPQPDNDPLKHWQEQWRRENPDETGARLADLFEHYRGWARQQGYQPQSSTRFAASLHRLGWQRIHVPHGTYWTSPISVI